MVLTGETVDTRPLVHVDLPALTNVRIWNSEGPNHFSFDHIQHLTSLTHLDTDAA